ncbi:phospholipase-like protein [Tanacetum coccineum]|uniref:Phospholipase-like protein n=1 Tax=Tanacetum coccineum TaxID=301880 RepID=A0ABQ5AWU1_9ASTR
MYKIGNNHFEFGKQEFCLITGFAFGKIPKVDTFNGLQNSHFCDRVFPNKIAEPLKKVRVLEVLEVIRSPERWSALSDEDNVKVCLSLVSNIVFMGREFKNYIADNLIELIDDMTAWDAYPWGEYFWRASYRSLVKIGKFEKRDYGALFAEWSNPIMSMAPTSTELLQPWLIRSMDYFRTLLVDGQPNDPITASPKGIQLNICNAVVHDPWFEQQSKQVMESVLVFTSDELVAVYHSITTSVQLIENV